MMLSSIQMLLFGYLFLGAAAMPMQQLNEVVVNYEGQDIEGLMEGHAFDYAEGGHIEGHDLDYVEGRPIEGLEGGLMDWTWPPYYGEGELDYYGEGGLMEGQGLDYYGEGGLMEGHDLNYYGEGELDYYGEAGLMEGHGLDYVEGAPTE